MTTENRMSQSADETRAEKVKQLRLLLLQAGMTLQERIPGMPNHIRFHTPALETVHLHVLNENGDILEMISEPGTDVPALVFTWDQYLHSLETTNSYSLDEYTILLAGKALDEWLAKNPGYELDIDMIMAEYE